MIRLLTAAQWQQDKRTAALEARRHRLDRTRQIKDATELLCRLNSDGRYYGQQAFNEWLYKRRLTAGPTVLDRFDFQPGHYASCSRDHYANTAPVRYWLAHHNVGASYSIGPCCLSVCLPVCLCVTHKYVLN